MSIDNQIFLSACVVNSKLSFYSRRNNQNDQKLSPFTSNGFEEWYSPIQPNINELEVFLVDFKTEIYQEEIEEEAGEQNDYDNYESERPTLKKATRDVSGVILYFLAFDEKTNLYYWAFCYLL